METGKKRTSVTEPLNVEAQGVGLASSYSRGHRTMTSRTGAAVSRTASPPAQAYFESPHDDSSAPVAVDANAGSHFAYSTTLRRHGVGESPSTGRMLGLEARNNSWGHLDGSGSRAGLEGGYGAEAAGMGLEPMRGKHADDTVSTKYASMSIQVRRVPYSQGQLITLPF